MRTRLAITLPLLIAAGCRFDTSVPTSASILCETDADCLDGRVCSPSLKRCVQQGGDKDAPSLTASTVMPAIVNRAGTATATFSTNELILGEPGLSVEGFTLKTRQPNPGVDGETFTYTYSAPATAAEGTLNLKVHLIDLSGNESDFTVGALTLDFTPPQVLPNSVSVSPDLARPGETVQAQVAFSEPLGLAPELTYGAGERVPSLNAAGAFATYRIVLSPTTADGVLKLSLASIVDVAGNSSSPGDIGELRIDTNQPRITTLAIVDGHTVRSAEPGFNTFTVIAEGDVGLGDELRALDLTFLGTPLSCTKPSASRRECAVTVTAAMPEGDNATIQALATDKAGNSVSKSVTLRLDFTAPSVVVGSVQPTYFPGPLSRSTQVSSMGSGGRLVVGFSTTETLGMPVALALDGHTMVCTNVGLAESCSYTHQCSTLADGQHTMMVTLVDSVGNAFSGSLMNTPILSDCLPPAAPNVATPGKVSWRRAPWGAAWSPQKPGLALSVAADAVSEQNLTLLLGNSIGGNQIDVLATGPVGTAVGATVITPAEDVDRVRVWVQVVDSAGNGSPVVRVVDNSVTVAFAGVNDAAVGAPTFWRASSLDDVQLTQFAAPFIGPTVRTRALKRTTIAAPPKRTWCAMTGLGNSKGLIMGGALGGSPLNDTWVFDGITGEWHEVQGSKPQSRAGAELAPLGGGKALLFGGISNGTTLSDSWVYDLASDQWSATSGVQPPPRNQTGLVGIGNGQALLFGGGGNSGALSDTWLYQVATNTWSDLTSSTGLSPPARFGHTLTSLGDGTVLLLGGMLTDYFTLGEPYLFDVATKKWSLIVVPNGQDEPGAHSRRLNGVTVTTAPGQAVLFGGYDQDGNYDVAVRFDGTSRTFTIATGNQPAGINAGQLANLGNGKVVTFGGENIMRAVVNDTQVLDVATMVWSSATQDLVPAARLGHRMISLAAGQALLFGGESGRDTWVFETQTGWRQMTDSSGFTEGTPAASLGDGRLIRFGNRAGGQGNETWLLDTTTKVWRQLALSVRPPARMWPMMRHIDDHDVVLFGGKTGAVEAIDTWYFDGTAKTWAQAVTGAGTTPGPATSGRASMAPLANGRVLLIDNAGAGWVFSKSTKLWAPTGSGAAVRQDSKLAALGPTNAVMIGGYPTTPGPADTWLLDGTTMTWSHPGGVGSAAFVLRAMSITNNSEALALHQDSAWRMSDTTRSWAATLGFPTNVATSFRDITPMHGGAVLVGGQSVVGGDSDWWFYDPPTNRWSELARFRLTPVTGLRPLDMGGDAALLEEGESGPYLIETDGEATAAVGVVTLAQLGLVERDVSGVRASSTAGADGFTKAGSARPGVELQLYGAGEVGPLFETCASSPSPAASATALSCPERPVSARSSLALRIRPAGFSNLNLVDFTVQTAALEVLYH